MSKLTIGTKYAGRLDVEVKPLSTTTTSPDQAFTLPRYQKSKKTSETGTVPTAQVAGAHCTANNSETY
jgi:hypothetical protein